MPYFFQHLFVNNAYVRAENRKLVTIPHKKYVGKGTSIVENGEKSAEN